MTREALDTGWAVRKKTSIFADVQGQGALGEVAHLPHDALISADRSPESGSAANGYFPDGAFEYRRSVDVPLEWRGKSVALEFEGVYRDAMVFVNGEFVAQRPNGYSRFFVALDGLLRFGETNALRVDARTHDDSRWYAGAGLHRPVHLWVADSVHLDFEDGVRVSTPDIDDERAEVSIAYLVRNDGLDTRTVSVLSTVLSPDGERVASVRAPVTLRPGTSGTVRHRLFVTDAALWSTDSPNLYGLQTVIEEGDETIDRRATDFGIRRLQLDPVHGLRINGETVKLRGACVHSDNGILGAAAYRAADERRVIRLKEAGFNALRSSHNPMSVSMLDACDRHGMLVLDETFDMWTEAKSPFDYSVALPEWWRRDVSSMVFKNRNHPSVVMYSIGNEIPETGKRIGSSLGREMAELIRELDPTRWVTNGINGFVSALEDVVAGLAAKPAPGADGDDGGVNALMGNPGDFMNNVSSSDLVTAKTEESFAVLDVVGINYGDARYERDQVTFPNRIVMGSETFPSHIDVNWELVKRIPQVIGDFTWAGWDYLGEAGVGRIQYHDEPRQFAAPFPWLTAWVGDIDLCGERRPISQYRETVFGLRTAPFVTVLRPELAGRPHTLGQWSWPDSLPSWTWSVSEGTLVEVEVYADADEVELFVNGASAGRTHVGEEKAFIARLEVPYHAGELLAVSYRGNEAVGRTVLHTAAGPTHIVARLDEAPREQDVLFVEISLEDADGVVIHNADQSVTVRIDGDGTLTGFGSAQPANPESYAGHTHRTFNGKALAVVRPTGSGPIVVSVESAEAGRAILELALGDDGRRLIATDSVVYV